jgi:hypothetical protein
MMFYVLVPKHPQAVIISWSEKSRFTCKITTRLLSFGGMEDEEFFPLMVAKFPAHLTRGFLVFIKML